MTENCSPPYPAPFDYWWLNGMLRTTKYYGCPLSGLAAFRNEEIPSGLRFFHCADFAADQIPPFREIDKRRNFLCQTTTIRPPLGSTIVLLASESRSPRRKSKIGNASSTQPARQSRERGPAVFPIRRVTSATDYVRNASSAAFLMMHPSIFPSTVRWRLHRRTAHETVFLPTMG